MRRAMNNPPLLYYRSPEQIKEYRSMPVLQKIRKLEMEMELYYYVQLEKVKRMSDKPKG